MNTDNRSKNEPDTEMSNFCVMIEYILNFQCWGLSFLTRILEKSVAPQFTKQGCRKNLCQGALAKLPKSAKACQICKEVVKISSISLKSFQTMFLGILQGVDEAVCSELNNTAASALVSAS